NPGGVVGGVESNGNEAKVRDVALAGKFLKARHAFGGGRAHIRHGATGENKVDDGIVPAQRFAEEKLPLLIPECEGWKLFANGAKGLGAALTGVTIEPLPEGCNGIAAGGIIGKNNLQALARPVG